MSDALKRLWLWGFKPWKGPVETFLFDLIVKNKDRTCNWKKDASAKTSRMICQMCQVIV